MKILEKSGDHVIFTLSSYLLLPICIFAIVIGLIFIQTVFPVGIVFIGLAVVAVIFIPSKTRTTVNLLGVEIEKMYWFSKKQNTRYDHKKIESCIHKLATVIGSQSTPGGLFIRVNDDKNLITDICLFEIASSQGGFRNSFSNKPFLSKDKEELIKLIPIILRKPLKVLDSEQMLSERLDGIRNKVWEKHAAHILKKNKSNGPPSYE